MGRREEYQCRFVAEGLIRFKGLQYKGSSSTTPTPSSIGMALALMALADWEGRQRDVQVAHLEADVEEELYIELHGGYPERSRNQLAGSSA